MMTFFRECSRVFWVIRDKTFKGKIILYVLIDIVAEAYAGA